MKNLSIYAAMIFVVPPVFAAQFHDVKQLANPGLEAAMLSTGTANAFNKAVKIDQLTAAKGKSDADLRKGTIGQVLHADCEFFDDGVNIAKVDGDAKSIGAAVDDFVDQFIDNSDGLKAQLKTDLLTAIKVGNVDIYSGNASGNNTMGTVLGIYDLDHDEVLGSAFTNCGSDN
jgi:hypothetical protein